MKFKAYCGSDLFQINIKNSPPKKKGKIKNYDYPFNVEFKKRKEAVNKDNKGEFHGSGIYLITYKEEIIYIGKYMPYGKGNVITDRWIKHIATITNRGHRVGGFGNEKIRNKENLKYPTLKDIEKKDEHIDNILELIKKAGRIHDTGFSISVKRLAFAEKNWNSFKEQREKYFEENVLPKFQFHYMQLNGYKEGKIPASVKIKEYYENLASLVETYLLWKYNPVCNSNEGFNKKDDISPSKIETEINSFLKKLN